MKQIVSDRATCPEGVVIGRTATGRGVVTVYDPWMRMSLRDLVFRDGERLSSVHWGRAPGRNGYATRIYTDRPEELLRLIQSA